MQLQSLNPAPGTGLACGLGLYAALATLACLLLAPSTPDQIPVPLWQDVLFFSTVPVSGAGVFAAAVATHRERRSALLGLAWLLNLGSLLMAVLIGVVMVTGPPPQL